MYTGETEMLPIQGIRSVIYTGRTNRYVYRGGVQLCIQGRGSVMYTGETEPLSIQGEGVPLPIQGKTKLSLN